MAGRKRDSFVCPHCGADVPEGMEACPKCGSDAETGWAEDASSSDIPVGYSNEDDGFDYEEYVAREFPKQPGRWPTRSKRQWVWMVAVILLAIALLLSVLHG